MTSPVFLSVGCGKCDTKAGWHFVHEKNEIVVPAQAHFLWLAEKLTSLLPRKQRKEVIKVVRKLDSSPIQLKGRGYDEWTLVNKTLRCQGI